MHALRCCECVCCICALGLRYEDEDVCCSVVFGTLVDVSVLCGPSC